MRNVLVEKKVTVTIDLTADQWQLYNEPDREDIARAMNGRIEHHLNNGDYKAAYKILDEYSDYGAADSEGWWVLKEIIDLVKLA